MERLEQLQRDNTPREAIERELITMGQAAPAKERAGGTMAFQTPENTERAIQVKAIRKAQQEARRRHLGPAQTRCYIRQALACCMKGV